MSLALLARPCSTGAGSASMHLLRQHHVHHTHHQERRNATQTWGDRWESSQLDRQGPCACRWCLSCITGSAAARVSEWMCGKKHQACQWQFGWYRVGRSGTWMHWMCVCDCVRPWACPWRISSGSTRRITTFVSDLGLQHETDDVNAICHKGGMTTGP